MHTSLYRLRSERFKPAATASAQPPAPPAPPLLRHRRFRSVCATEGSKLTRTCPPSPAHSKPPKLISTFKQRLLVPLRAQEELLDSLFRRQDQEEEEDFLALCKDCGC